MRAAVLILARVAVLWSGAIWIVLTLWIIIKKLEARQGGAAR